MTDNNASRVTYEQFLDFVIPRTKKRITQKLVKKIKQQEIPLIGGKLEPASYEGVCVLAKLLECEIQVLKKIQRRLLKYA